MSDRWADVPYVPGTEGSEVDRLRWRLREVAKVAIDPRIEDRVARNLITDLLMPTGCVPTIPDDEWEALAEPVDTGEDWEALP